MAEVTYTVVEHDGGYAYRVGETWSETYPDHAAALHAAQAAAAEQQVPGATEAIRYQEADGAVHEETAQGDDRPVTRVEDAG